MAIIYTHRKATTLELFYVGFSGQVSDRRAFASDKTSRSEYWSRVSKKYGVVVDVVARGNRQDMLELEEFIIEEIGLDNLVNHQPGGAAITHSQETKDKMSKAAKGVKKSEEHKLSLSKAHKGKPSKGKLFKKRQTPWNKGKVGIYSSDTIKKMSEASKKRKYITRKVVQLSKEGVVIKIHDSIKIAGEAVGINFRSISRAALGQREYAAGFRWKYYGCN